MPSQAITRQCGDIRHNSQKEEKKIVKINQSMAKMNGCLATSLASSLVQYQRHVRCQLEELNSLNNLDFKYLEHSTQANFNP